MMAVFSDWSQISNGHQTGLEDSGDIAQLVLIVVQCVGLRRCLALALDCSC